MEIRPIKWRRGFEGLSLYRTYPISWNSIHAITPLPYLHDMSPAGRPPQAAYLWDDHLFLEDWGDHLILMVSAWDGLGLEGWWTYLYEQTIDFD